MLVKILLEFQNKYFNDFCLQHFNKESKQTLITPPLSLSLLANDITLLLIKEGTLDGKLAFLAIIGL